LIFELQKASVIFGGITVNFITHIHRIFDGNLLVKVAEKVFKPHLHRNGFTCQMPYPTFIGQNFLLKDYKRRHHEKQKRYTHEFKSEAVKLVLEQVSYIAKTFIQEYIETSIIGKDYIPYRVIFHQPV